MQKEAQTLSFYFKPCCASNICSGFSSWRTSRGSPLRIQLITRKVKREREACGSCCISARDKLI